MLSFTFKRATVEAFFWEPQVSPQCHLRLRLGFRGGSPLQPRHDVGFGRGIPPRKPLTKVATSNLILIYNRVQT